LQEKPEEEPVTDPVPRQDKKTLEAMVTRNSVVRVRSDKLDDLQAVAGELVVLNLQQEGGQEQAEKIRDRLSELQSSWRDLQGQFDEGIESSAWREQKFLQTAKEFTRKLKEIYQI